jgi:hypothetical protein
MTAVRILMAVCFVKMNSGGAAEIAPYAVAQTTLFDHKLPLTLDWNLTLYTHPTRTTFPAQNIADMIVRWQMKHPISRDEPGNTAEVKEERSKMPGVMFQD